MLEERVCYPALALTVLAVFYGIYFGKMLVQKHHGIRTHQIGRRKEKELHSCNARRCAADGDEFHPQTEECASCAIWLHVRLPDPGIP